MRAIMRAIVNPLLLVVSCALGLVAQSPVIDAQGESFFDLSKRLGPGAHEPVLAGLAALALAWLWRRKRR